MIEDEAGNAPRSCVRTSGSVDDENGSYSTSSIVVPSTSGAAFSAIVRHLDAGELVVR